MDTINATANGSNGQPHNQAPRATQLLSDTDNSSLKSAPIQLVSAPGAQKQDIRLRLQAVRRPTPVPTPGDHHRADPLDHPRNAQGQPRLRSIIFVKDGLPADKPLEDTPMKDEVDVVARHMPGLAARFHHVYNNEVLKALHVAQDLSRSKYQALADFNLTVEACNKDLEARVAELEMERDECSKPQRDVCEQAQKHLDATHTAAVQAVAQTGGVYDPQNPSETAVLRHRKRSLEEIAGQHGIPWPESDKKVVPPSWLMTLLTSNVGVMLGLSIAVFVQILVSFQAVSDKPVVAIIVAMLGIGLAMMGGYSAKMAFYHVGQRQALGQKFGFAMAKACLLAISLIGLEATVEFQGFKRTIDVLPAAYRPPLWTVFVLSMVFVFAYVACSSFVGYFKGRQDAHLNQLLNLQEQEFLALDKAARAQQPVQDALHAIGKVREAIRVCQQAQTHLNEVIAPFKGEIARLMTLYREVRDDLSLDDKRLIENAQDQCLGLYAKFKEKLEVAREMCEPAPPRGLLAVLKSWLQQRRRVSALQHQIPRL